MKATTIQSMTIERANQITDGIEDVLRNPQLIARQFKPLSRTGALSRLELTHAMYIVTAQVFKATSGSPDRAAEFAVFAQSAESSLWHVLYLQPCLPDSELQFIARLDEDSSESIKESIRLSELAQNDGTMKLETIDSFVSHLRTLNPNGVDYWPKVYQRIGLACPVEFSDLSKQDPAPARKKSWSRPW